MSIARESEYNGKPLLELAKDADTQIGFKFGVKKAQMILNHVDDIRAFVEKNDKVPARVA